MIDNRRPSGRSSPQTARSSSSHRLPAQQATTSRQSNRLSAQSASASARSSSRDSQSAAPKKRQRGGPELLIAAGVIAVLAIAAGIMYFVKQKESSNVNSAIRQQNEIMERNWKLAEDTFRDANNLGYLYCVQGDELTEDMIRQKFGGNDKVYNICYDRAYKDNKNKDQSQQRNLNDRKSYHSMSVPNKEGASDKEIKFNYGLADNFTLPVIIGKKHINSKSGDKANSGGNIAIVVRAEKDMHFEKAMAAKSSATSEKK